MGRGAGRRRCAAGTAGSTTSPAPAAATSASRATSWPPASPTSRSSGCSRCCCWSPRSSGCCSRATRCCRSSSSTRSARRSPVRSGEQLVHEVTSAVDSAGVIGLIGLVGFVYAGLRTMDKLRIGMELIWKGRVEKSDILRDNLQDLLALVVLGGIGLLSLGLTGAVTQATSRVIEAARPRRPRLRREGPDLGARHHPRRRWSTSSSSCGCFGSCRRSRTRCAAPARGRCSARPASRCSRCSAASTCR